MTGNKLWFDVESKYEATGYKAAETGRSCGLMQNQNMKQLKVLSFRVLKSCGLMQNQNMKQRYFVVFMDMRSCGLMQNQNMKQRCAA